MYKCRCKFGIIIIKIIDRFICPVNGKLLPELILADENGMKEEKDEKQCRHR